MDAHNQTTTNNYVVHYPSHEPREKDPHYRDFDAYRKATQATAVCAVGGHRQDFSECDGGLELHHSHIEFSLQNGVDLKWLEIDYPGVSDPDSVGAWVETGANLMWLCMKHHRAAGAGIHHAAYADYEASKYVRTLLSGRKDSGN